MVETMRSGHRPPSQAAHRNSANHGRRSGGLDRTAALLQLYLLHCSACGVAVGFSRHPRCDRILRSQRTREIGICMALGAEARDVLEMVIGQGSLLVMVGIVWAWPFRCGDPARWLRSSTGFNPLDPIQLPLGPLDCWRGVALLASRQHPARRAIRVDPMVALRSE